MNLRPNFTTAAGMFAVFSIFFWAQADDAQRVGNMPTPTALAQQEEADAMVSREWAGQQVCGPNATPEWLDDKQLACLRHADQPTQVAAGRP